MTIYPITQVRAAYERALELSADHETAIRAAAQSLGLAVSVVREVVEGVAACAS